MVGSTEADGKGRGSRWGVITKVQGWVGKKTHISQTKGYVVHPWSEFTTLLVVSAAIPGYRPKEGREPGAPGDLGLSTTL